MPDQNKGGLQVSTASLSWKRKAKGDHQLYGPMLRAEELNCIKIKLLGMLEMSGGICYNVDRQ
jgi:hypothetical protein